MKLLSWCTVVSEACEGFSVRGVRGHEVKVSHGIRHASTRGSTIAIGSLPH